MFCLCCRQIQGVYTYRHRRSFQKKNLAWWNAQKKHMHKMTFFLSCTFLFFKRKSNRELLPLFSFISKTLATAFLLSRFDHPSCPIQMQNSKVILDILHTQYIQSCARVWNPNHIFVDKTFLTKVTFSLMTFIMVKSCRSCNQHTCTKVREPLTHFADVAKFPRRPCGGTHGKKGDSEDCHSARTHTNTRHSLTAYQ